jgi:hypothetical protein
VPTPTTKQIRHVFVEHADAVARDEMADRARPVSAYALLASLPAEFHPIFPGFAALKTLVGRWYPLTALFGCKMMALG